MLHPMLLPSEASFMASFLRGSFFLVRHGKKPDANQNIEVKYSICLLGQFRMLMVQVGSWALSKIRRVGLKLRWTFRATDSWEDLRRTETGPFGGESQHKSNDWRLGGIIDWRNTNLLDIAPLWLSSKKRTTSHLVMAEVAFPVAMDQHAPRHARTHTVSLLADEIPFDLFWPMVRDDVFDAVRETCLQAKIPSESAMKASSWSRVE